MVVAYGSICRYRNRMKHRRLIKARKQQLKGKKQMRVDIDLFKSGSFSYHDGSIRISDTGLKGGSRNQKGVKAINAEIIDKAEQVLGLIQTFLDHSSDSHSYLNDQYIVTELKKMATENNIDDENVSRNVLSYLVKLRRRYLKRLHAINS